MPNHYEVLHLAPDATQEQIRVSYHKLARELHPDRRRRRSRQQQKGTTPATPPAPALRPTRPHAPDSDRCETADDLVRSSSCDEDHVGTKSSEQKAPEVDMNNEGCDCAHDDDDDYDERFRKVQDAYRCLYDPSKRRDYDEALRLQENRRKSRRRSAVALAMSDCRWVSETPAVESQSRSGGENGHKQVSHGHHDSSVDAKDQALTLDVDGDAAAVLVYTCRCGEDLYPLEDDDEDDALGGSEVDGDEGCLLDCPGCSAVYDVSVLREEADEQGPPLS
jgi:DnaJ domain